MLPSEIPSSGQFVNPEYMNPLFSDSYNPVCMSGDAAALDKNGSRKHQVVREQFKSTGYDWFLM